AALPELLSGLKVAATLAVTGAVVGEFVGANSGLGYVILQANGNIDTAMLFAALIIMSALGVLLFAVIQVAEALLIPWHASRRNRGSPRRRTTAASAGTPRADRSAPSTAPRSEGGPHDRPQAPPLPETGPGRPHRRRRGARPGRLRGRRRRRRGRHRRHPAA